MISPDNTVKHVSDKSALQNNFQIFRVKIHAIGINYKVLCLNRTVKKSCGLLAMINCISPGPNLKSLSTWEFF